MDALRSWLRDAIRLTADWVRGGTDSLRENLSIGVLAVGVALFLWVFITDQENPTTTVDVTPPVRVRAVNVPEGLAVLGLSQQLAVRASAPRDVAQRLNAADFRATVDLDGMTMGTHDAPVRVEYIGGSRSVRVIQVVPSRATLTLQPLRSVTVPVRADVATKPPLGYEADDQIEVDPPLVRVSGPGDLIDRVVEAEARVDLGTATKDIQANVVLVATNGSSAIDGVTIDPSSVRVRVSIRQTLFERSFAVSPRLKGSPPAGYAIESIQVDPTTVVLQGPLASLDRVDAAPTEEIDVGSAVADVVQQAKLVLPQGLRTKGPLQTVQVRIRIVPTTGRATFGVPPTLEGLGDGLVVRSLVPLVEVQVEGPLPQLRVLGPSSITAVVSLSGLGVGRHDVAVAARVPAGLKVVGVRPERITVEITR